MAPAMKNRNNLYTYMLCALFAALVAICSQIFVPLPFTPVPINLALLALWVCGGVLGAKKGAIAIIVYILLGMIGVPVFAGFQGGLGVLAGPTGGYIIGYLPAVIIMGLLSQGSLQAGQHPANEALVMRGRKAVVNVLLIILRGLPALVACYALGTAWFIISTGTGFWAAMLMCVIPFIPGDALKLVAAAVVCEALRKPMRALAKY